MLAVSTLFDRRHGSVVIFVTGAGTVSQFRDSVRCVAKLLMLARFIVIGVATGTIWCVCSARIGYRLRVALMAIQAIEWLCVCTRIIRRLVLIIERRCPGGCSMTIDAFNCGHEMVAGFTRRFAAIMAGTAIARYICVIESSGQPRHRFVTITAICSRCYVIGMLACGFGPVVTARASARRLAMIHTDSRPCGRDMAAITAIGCRYVGRGFARCFGPIVATDAGAKCVHV